MLRGLLYVAMMCVLSCNLIVSVSNVVTGVRICMCGILCFMAIATPPDACAVCHYVACSKRGFAVCSCLLVLFR